MIIYFITRFSIYDPQFDGFKLSRENQKDLYRQLLFGKNRLDQKFTTFQNITLPSITNQTSDDWVWLIFTSNKLPQEYFNKLIHLIDDSPKIFLIPVKDFNEFFEKNLNYKYQKPYATVRIDDDDGLNLQYVEKLQNYKKHNGSIISFTEGTLVKIKNNNVIKGEKYSEKNIALGMAGIGMAIYGLGRHKIINEKFDVIYDSSPNMYFLNCSPYTDTKRGFTSFERNFRKIKKRLISKFKRLLSFNV